MLSLWRGTLLSDHADGPLLMRHYFARDAGAPHRVVVIVLWIPGSTEQHQVYGADHV